LHQLRRTRQGIDRSPRHLGRSNNPKLATNIAEIQARGGRLITIESAGSTVNVVGNPDVPWGPLGSAVPMQILARTMALALGHDVDKP